MDELFASGDWHVTAGSEDEFVQRWTEFLEWTRAEHPGLVSVSLLRDADDPSHFVSIAEWRDEDARGSWKASDGCMERFSACRKLCGEMRGADYQRVVTI